MGKTLGDALEPLCSRPRAIGTIPIFGRDGGRGPIAVLADDRATRATLCTRAATHGFVPLPAATPLDAILILERVGPRVVIIADPALGLRMPEVVDFLAHEYPAIARVLLDPVVDDLDAALDELSPPRPPARRALVIIRHPSLRHAVCDCLADFGWKSVGVADMSAAEHVLATASFDVAVLDASQEASCDVQLRRLRASAAEIPAIVCSGDDVLPALGKTATVSRMTCRSIEAALADATRRS